MFASTWMMLAALVLSGPQPKAHSQQPSSPAVPDYVSFTRRIPNGLVNVGALELPDAFVRRVADRSLRSHFRMLYRQVAPPEGGPLPDEEAERDVDGAPNDVRVVDGAIAQDVRDRWADVINRHEVAELRGYKAPLEPGAIDWRMVAPSREEDPETRAAVLFVAESLASQGLVRTTLAVIRTQDVFAPGEALDMNTLASVGIPVDLLAMYTAGGEPMIDRMQTWWLRGGSEGDSNALADRARFEFKPTRSGFTLMAEGGRMPADILRMQLPSVAYYKGPGDGTPVDVLRQLVCAPHGWHVLATVRQHEVEMLRDAALEWPMGAGSRLTLVSTPVAASQWAQDNGKVGFAANENGAAAVVTLVPRVASVNEQMTKCVAADSLVMESLRGAIGDIAQSPLLFQGGNMMCVELPSSGERVLLVGEAEVYRNRALGLSEREVLSAFQQEFGVDRCVVMPAISFHIDMEFTVRRVGDELVAVVGDDVLAARIILAEALRAFAEAGLMDASAAQPLIDDLNAGRQGEALVAISKLIAGHISQEGKLHGAFVEALSTSPVDVPDAAAGRVLHAMDLLTAVEAREAGASLSPNHEHERMYRESLLRRLDERAAHAKQLEDLGMSVVHVPNLGDEELGVNVINTLHVPGATLIPVTGGIFKALDEAAMAGYRSAFGESVEIVPITTTYVQSKYGGVHCMVSLYPAVEK